MAVVPGGSPNCSHTRVASFKECLRLLPALAGSLRKENTDICNAFDDEECSSPTVLDNPLSAHSLGARSGSQQEDCDEARTEASTADAAGGWAMLRLFSRAPIGQSLGKAETRPAFGFRAFEIADDMEAGYAKESPTDFTTPLRKSGRLWRFRILRSEDRMSARLVAETGEFLMYAQTSLEARLVSFFLYDPALEHEKALFDPRSPVFSMTFNENCTVWRLVQEHCENCQLLPAHLSCSRRGKQQLALIRHHRNQIGDGVSNVMEIVIPGIFSDGRALVWCPMLGRSDLSQPQERDFETQRLVTKLPAWNPQVESLVLDFKGRNVVSSAKNFQLAFRQKPDHVLCQYGKLSDTNFGLDFKFPLSVAQAFAIAISTMFWV